MWRKKPALVNVTANTLAPGLEAELHWRSGPRKPLRHWATACLFHRASVDGLSICVLLLPEVLRASENGSEVDRVAIAILVSTARGVPVVHGVGIRRVARVRIVHVADGVTTVDCAGVADLFAFVVGNFIVASGDFQSSPRGDAQHRYGE